VGRRRRTRQALKGRCKTPVKPGEGVVNGYRRMVDRGSSSRLDEAGTRAVMALAGYCHMENRRESAHQVAQDVKEFPPTGARGRSVHVTSPREGRLAGIQRLTVEAASVGRCGRHTVLQEHVELESEARGNRPFPIREANASSFSVGRGGVAGGCPTRRARKRGPFPQGPGRVQT
jgi:hypothetical protein